jgi:hypothetical protein
MLVLKDTLQTVFVDNSVRSALLRVNSTYVWDPSAGHLAWLFLRVLRFAVKL